MPTTTYPTFFRVIKNRDIFGHKVRLNFDNKGNKHQTLCGGLITIALYIFVILIVGTRWSNLSENYDGYEFLSFVGGLMYIYHAVLDYLIKPF